MGIRDGAARRLTRRLGVDLRRWPDPSAYDTHRHRLFMRNNVNLVLDVGANTGQYARSIREYGYHYDILSFEPAGSAYARLAAAANADSAWLTRQLALGDETKPVTLNIAGNNGASSSVLPMLKRHRDAAPEANYIGVETVSQVPLDSLAEPWLGRRIHLKLDVQGYEGHVLDGAVSLLAGPVCSLELELSFVPLYERGILFADALDRLHSSGFELSTLRPGFRDPRSQELLQADGMFIRTRVG